MAPACASRHRMLRQPRCVYGDFRWWKNGAGCGFGWATLTRLIRHLSPTTNGWAWSGEGYVATPFFMMEISANYQYLHDNLLDSTHVSFVHSGALDSGDEMASAKLNVEENGRFIRISYDTTGSIFP